MRWQNLTQTIEESPLFETSLFVSGDVTRHQAQRQLSDWAQNGRLLQLRRGLYALPDGQPHPFIVANQLVKGSYVSLQMALSHYHMIPEYVAVVTSVTTQRSGKWENKFGRFSYRHLNPSLFFGITYRRLVRGQHAFVATPEKALLDLIYMRPQGDTVAYIESLRLQNLEILNFDRLHALARQSGKPKLQRAAERVETFAVNEMAEYETL